MTNKALPKNLPSCPVETTLLLLGNKWSILILRNLFDQPRRFGQLQKSIGFISQKVLTANLRSLEEKGIIHREVYPVIPPHVEYSLTDLGQSLRPIIDSMREWGENYKKQQN